MRIRSALLAHFNRRFSSIPVLAASSLRPFGLLAASRRPVVVRIPARFNAAASSGAMPSIRMTGYDMKILLALYMPTTRGSWSVPSQPSLTFLNSDELTKTRNRADDLADRILARFFPSIGDDLAGDA